MLASVRPSGRSKSLIGSSTLILYIQSVCVVYLVQISNSPLQTHYIQTQKFQYGVATMSRLLKMIGLCCERALQKSLYSAEETYNFKKPANRSHPIGSSRLILDTHYTRSLHTLIAHTHYTLHTPITHYTHTLHTLIVYIHYTLHTHITHTHYAHPLHTTHTHYTHSLRTPITHYTHTLHTLIMYIQSLRVV